MQPSVSLLVINHNRAQLLKACLESLLRQTLPPQEILVVDNGSSDDSRRVVEGLTGISWVGLPENRGFAAACNIGIARSRGELIGLCNNDAVFEPAWLQALVEVMQCEERVGMCASKILFYGTTLIDKAGHLMYWDGQNRGRGTGEPDRGQYDRREEALFPDGCAALYRRRLLEEVGGFDESFFAYGDDADLGLRARWRGWKCLYVPEAVAYHHHSATSGRFSPQKVYWVERNRLWVAVKNFPLPLLLLNPLATLHRWAWNLLAGLLGRGPAGEFRKETSWLVLFRTLGRAYWDGLRWLGPHWRQRRRIRQERQISSWAFLGLLCRFRISARRLAFQEAPLSVGNTAPETGLGASPKGSLSCK